MGEGATTNSYTVLDLEYEDALVSRRLYSEVGIEHRSLSTLVYNVDLKLNGNTFSEILGTFGMIAVSHIPTFASTNDTLQNCIEFGASLYTLTGINDISIDGLVIKNHTISDLLAINFIHAIPNDIMLMTLSNVEVSDIVLGNSQIVSFSGTNNQFTLINSSFNNISVSDIGLIKVTNLDMININNVTFTGISNTDEVESPYILGIDALNLDSAEQFIIQNVVVSSTNIGFFHLDSIKNTAATTKVLELNNIQFESCEYEKSANLLNIEKILTTEDFYIQISEASFVDLNFEFGGNMIHMNAHMPKGLHVIDTVVRNVTSGSFLVESSNTQYSVPTLMILNNLTTEAVEVEYDSLIQIYDRAQLQIWDSELSNINCFEEGAVLFAGSESTQTTIYNTVIQNNAALQGGVFDIESKSIVTLHNCTLKNNFAIEGGVVWARSEGYFEFYNTTITENYALSLSVGEIFDSVIESTLNNCVLNNNEVISNEEFLSEINSR